jgi:hypothetical protein
MKRLNKIHLSTGAACLLLAGLLLARPGVSAAGSVLDVVYGSPATVLGPEADAMAGTGAALYRGGLSARLNPAMLAQEREHRLDGAVALYQDHEDRFQPLWDSFGSYVADTAIASQRNHYFDSGFGAALRATEDLAVGLSLGTLYDFTYDFEEEVRDPDPTSDPYDQILEERSWRSDGRLRALTLGFAMSTPDERLSVGIAGNYAFGTRHLDASQRYFQDPDASWGRGGEHWMEGGNAVLGIHVKASPRVEIGMAWETPLEVSGEAKTVESTYDSGTEAWIQTAEEMDATIKYPGRYRAGFTLYPRSDPRTVFAVELVHTPWTDLEEENYVGEDDIRLVDTYDVRIGVEHLFYNGVPLRFGFRRLDSYSDHEAGATFFTTGVGIPWERGLFHVSAELSKVSSHQEHWFDYVYPDPEIQTAETARVEETRFRLGAGFTYRF